MAYSSFVEQPNRRQTWLILLEVWKQWEKVFKSKKKKRENDRHDGWVGSNIGQEKGMKKTNKTTTTKLNDKRSAHLLSRGMAA